MKHPIRQRSGLAATGIALGVALVMTLAACGGGSTGSSSSPVSGFDAATKGVRNPSTTTGGTLQLVNDDSVDSLDPARSYYGYVWNLMRLYTRQLLTFDAKTGQAGQKLVSDLAVDVPVGEDGGKKWTYKLKPGLKFEDGSPITTKDIKYGVERSFAVDIINGGPSYFLCLLSTCDASGAAAYKGPYTPKGAELSSIATPDDTTITFNLLKPFPDFNYLVALPQASPIPVAKDTGVKLSTNPAGISSGPFKIEQFTPKKVIKFAKNTNWDQSTDAVRKPLVDAVVVTEGLSVDDVDNRIVANRADGYIPGTGVQVATQSKLLTDPALKARADNPDVGGTRYIAISSKVPPLDNVECRRAVQYAADKVALQAARGGPLAGGAIATTMWPPSLAGFTKIDPYPSGPDNKGDLVKAKEALTKCGKPDGFTVNMATSDKGKAVPVAVALQQALGRVGIKVTIKKSSSDIYYSEFIGSPNSVKTKGLGLMVAGWSPDYNTPFAFYSQIIDSRNIKAAGNSNYQETNDPEINSLIDQAGTEVDPAKALDIWRRVDAKLMDTATILPFVWDKALPLTSTRVKNVYVQGNYGYYEWVNMGVQ
jgi:peptide/nickel transport system substrate-binding protein